MFTDCTIGALNLYRLEPARRRFDDPAAPGLAQRNWLVAMWLLGMWLLGTWLQRNCLRPMPRC